jgi:hypothetical protein
MMDGFPQDVETGGGAPGPGAEWRALVTALDAAAGPDGPLAGWLFHGTSLTRAMGIAADGVLATDVLLPGGQRGTEDRWAYGTYWATPRVAAAYAEDRIAECAGAGTAPAIVAVRLDDLCAEGVMVPDVQSLDCPLEAALGRTAKEAIAAWEASAQEWQDCLELFGTVVCLAPVGPEHVHVIASRADLAALAAGAAPAPAPPGPRP